MRVSTCSLSTMLLSFQQETPYVGRHTGRCCARVAARILRLSVRARPLRAHQRSPAAVTDLNGGRPGAPTRRQAGVHGVCRQ